MLKLFVILLSLYFALILVKHSHAGGEAAHALAMKGKIFETWELLRFCALNFLELFRTKESSTSSFYGHYELVFFIENQNFHIMIYREKQFFVNFFFCQTNFVSLATENCFMVYNILASQRILIKASLILLWGINCGMSFKFILCLKD